MNKLIYLTATILTYLYTAAYINPAYAQLGHPMPGMIAPQPLKFYRVALISKQAFNRTEADAAMAVLKDLSDVYKSKVIDNHGTYKIAMMIRIIFFERKDADDACEFLKKHPMHEPNKYDIQVIEDSSY